MSQAAQATQAGEAAPVVGTATGSVRGAEVDGVARFLGIPYAAPPYGEHRLRGPQPVTPWEGVRDATEIGPTAPKGDYPEAVRALLPEIRVEGEECLNLNVWTPSPRASDGAGLPVLVWIHGGSFVNGSGANAEYDGTAFARDGVVCVTINYRLGAEGFLHLPDAEANRGLRDMLAALRWVSENISGFGGDPDRVTLGGESAGAMAVQTLLTLPETRGLVHQAVVQSAANGPVLTPEQATLVSETLAQRLGVPRTRDGFAGIAPDDLVAAVTALALEIRDPGSAAVWGAMSRLLPFAPVLDGELVTAHPLAEPTEPAVPALVGHNRDEARLFLVPSGLLPYVDEAFLTAFAAGFGVADLERFEGATPGERLSEVFTHARFAEPVRAFVESRSGSAAPTWTYLFEGLAPGDNDDLGSAHAAEIPFVFGTADRPAARPLVGSDPDPAVTATMHGTWVRFITTGDPGWAPGTRASLSDAVRAPG